MVGHFSICLTPFLLLENDTHESEDKREYISGASSHTGGKWLEGISFAVVI